MADLVRDLRLALRVLAKAPVFAGTVIVLLACGISANTLIFSLTHAVLMRPLPVREPQRLVRLVEVHPKNFVTWEFPAALCERAGQFRAELSEIICQGEAYVALRSGSESERVRVHFVSPNFFSSLGVGAYRGRILNAEDERTRAPVAVISYDFWRRKFQADRRVIGSKVEVGNAVLSIIGISPQQFNGFSLDTSPDLRVPMSTESALLGADQDAAHSERGFVEIYARLRRGVDRDEAMARFGPALQRA
jgi:hypothetical protein